MKQQGRFITIGHKALSINNLGRGQMSFIVSSMGSKNQSNGITKKWLMNRAGLKANHYSRNIKALDKHEDVLGEYNYDKKQKRVTSTYKLYRSGEQFVKVPRGFIEQRRISKHDISVLLVLGMFTHKEKNAWRSNVNSLVTEGNRVLEHKGYDLRLDLTSTYESIKRLEDLKLLTFDKTSKIVKGKTNKYFFNYISNIKLTDKFWDIGFDKEEDISIAPPEEWEVQLKIQKKVSDKSTESSSDLEWDDILEGLGEF